jgi:hypothetical protein
MMSRRTRQQENLSHLLKEGGEMVMQFRTIAVVAAITSMSLFASAADMNTQLDAAKDSLIRCDTKTAASDIRKAARCVEKESEHAGSDTKAALKDSARELEKVAADIEDGTVAGVDTVRAPFARACRAMAESHFAKSSEAFTNRMFSDAGKELEASAHDLEAAARWNGDEVDHAAVSGAHDARKLAGKLVQGSGWTAQEVGKTMRSFGSDLKSFGSRI